MTMFVSNGLLVLISGPSGSGKGTVLRGLRKRHPEYVFPLSLTTRKPRPKEKDGEVYHFVSREEFEQQKNQGHLLEWAIVHGNNYYGTLKEPIMKALEHGSIIVREVDVQGVSSICKIITIPQLVTIFLTTSSWEDLKQRILRRAAMSGNELQRRHKSYLREEKLADELFDYTVFSEYGKIDKMITDVENIIENSRKTLSEIH